MKIQYELFRVLTKLQSKMVVLRSIVMAILIVNLVVQYLHLMHINDLIITVFPVILTMTVAFFSHMTSM